MGVQEGAREEKGQEAVRELVTCPKCGHDNAKGERYCSSCGASLLNVAAGANKKKGGVLGKLFGKRS